MFGRPPIYFVTAQPPYFPDDLTPDEYGLVAIGGELSPALLIEAYRKGIFPWYEEPPALWFSPDPRLVLQPQEFHASRSLRRLLRRGEFRVRIDTEFSSVLRACAITPRAGQEGTWINDEMTAAYADLFALGIAHSVEVFRGDELCGGLYGIALGKCFFGESMFSAVSNASKVAAYWLCELLREKNFALIDCQVHTPHLASLGAVEIPRVEFLAHVNAAIAGHSLIESWPVGAWRS